ncbi:glucosaminidase domain-containing protein [Akkermansia muciniphila]|uniref:glucosaminidase domain-containing protein n=1 Tax=Akkermansia muciniphila TaxID=239935 RepID=UPI0020A4D62E|nr:glucosaminidase domain-containing protein [Akkermansia muciniphila]MCP2384136.1 glucosaminidase domain-containing protein [Akkermansia muciniphila]
MDRDESLINGPGVQPPASVNVPVPRDVTGDVLRRGVAQVGQNIDGMCREMVETEDSTKQFEQERILIQTQDEVGSEARRRLQLPDGDPDAFFDERGNFSKKALNNFASPYLKRLQGIGSGILNPDLARKMRFKAAVAGDKMLNDLFDSGKEVARKKQETALNSSLKLAEETNNWGWYEDLVHEGVRAGAIDSAKGNLLLFRGKKTASRHHFENLAATNPDLAADMINRGELDGYFSASEQDEMMRSLRRQDDNRLTEVVEQTASRPKSKNDRQAVTNALLSGPVYQEELGFHAVYERDGDYSACAPQIDSFIYRVADMVRAGEEGPDLASKKENVILLCKRYAKSAEFQKDVLNRMDKWAKRKEKYKMLNVSERMKEMDGAPLYRQADYNNVIGTLDAEAKNAWQLYADSSKGSDTPKDSEDTWIKRFKKEKIENLQKNLAAKTEIAVRDDFEAWFDGEVQGNGKEPSYVLQEDMLQTILRKVTGRNDLVIPSRGRLMDEYQQTASEKWRDRDSERFNAGPKLLSEGEKQTLRRKDMLRKPFTFPAMVSVDTVNTNAPAGILLPESMRQRFGDDVSGLAALVPSSSSSRRGKPLPVVGYTRGSSPQLTLSGASKLRMTFSSKMDTNVTISPASPEMREFFKKEYPGSQDWKQDAGESRVPAAKLGGLGQYSQAFYDAGRKYGVDPKLLMAIAMHETGKGTSAAFLRKNNAMGISPNGGGPRAFSSVEESINYAARLLRTHYLDQGLTTIAAIGGKYAPAGAGNDPRGLNKHWVNGVSKYYKSF